MSGHIKNLLLRAKKQALLEKFGVPVVDDVTEGYPDRRFLVDMWKEAKYVERSRKRNPSVGTWDERNKIDLTEKDAADKLDNLLQGFFERLSDIRGLTGVMESILSQIGSGPSTEENAAIRKQASLTNYTIQMKLSELRDWLNVDVGD